MWLMTYLRRRFLAFGPGADDEGKRELHALLRDIDRRGPRWYRPWTDRITPDFAESAEALRATLVPLGATFRLTIAGDKEAERDAVDALLGQALAASGLGLESFAFETIKEEAERREGELRATMDELFNKRLAVFRSKTVQRYALGFRQLARLAALWEFDFRGLLAPFSKKGGYGSCDAALVASALADLHFLINDLEIGREAIEVYGILRGLVEETLGGTWDPAAEIVGVASLLSKELRPDRLGAVVRAALGDATIALKAYDVACEACEARLQEIRDDYAAKRALLDASLRAAELEARKRAIFGDRELLGVLGYTEELSTMFSSKGLPAFSFVAPLSIVKTFMQLFFLSFIRGVISTLLIDADFLDKDFQRGLVASIDECSRVALELQTLEEELVSPGSSMLMPIVDALAKGRLDAAGRRRAEDGIERTERSCDTLVRTAFASFAELRASLEKFLIDLRAKKPELVANAQFLNRNKAKALSEVELASRLLSGCLRLLRFYSLDVGELERAIGKA
jgi:hypothetical protein